MQLFTSLSQMDALPASDLKSHLQARHRALYEDDMGPVFVIVEKTDRVDGPDYAFIGNRGLLSDLYEERAPKEDGFVRPNEWVSHLPELRLYEVLLLINGEDCYWIYVSEAIANANSELMHVMTAPELGGLSPPQIPQ
jgi:hypothetical protein